MDHMQADEIMKVAKEIRADILKMTTAAGSGHPGGSMSAADIMAVLYFSGLMRHDPRRPDWPLRDRFILSKGHVAPVLYAALARAGYLPVAELATLRQIDSRLQGHPDRLKLPGVEVSGGSLGQGLSIAAGMAYALAVDWAGQIASEATSDVSDSIDRPPYAIALLGDGECQEGQVWEAAMFAAHYRLGNLIAIIDENGLQIDGRTADVMDIGSMVGKLEQVGWQVAAVDGHDIEAIMAALSLAFSGDRQCPQAIVANTVKGKGVSFMEGQAAWHGKSLSTEQLALALAELGLMQGQEAR
jgi:transketolase